MECVIFMRKNEIFMNKMWLLINKKWVKTNKLKKLTRLCVTWHVLWWVSRVFTFLEHSHCKFLVRFWMMWWREGVGERKLGLLTLLYTNMSLSGFLKKKKKTKQACVACTCGAQQARALHTAVGRVNVVATWFFNVLFSFFFLLFFLLFFSSHSLPPNHTPKNTSY